MAILLVKVQDLTALLMNEFYDYDGVCYGITRSRMKNVDQCIDLEDFYEGTIQSDCIRDITTIFVTQDQDEQFVIVGWYKKSDVHKNVLRPSLFLEGNIVADSKNVCLLPEKEWKKAGKCQFSDKLYEVIESTDDRYGQLMTFVRDYKGQNLFIRLNYVNTFVDERVKKDYDACIEQCTRIASRLMSDMCRDIREIGLLEAYSEQACKFNRNSVNGYYYQAMANHQLGRLKKAIKAIEKALKLEPDASDLMAMKGHILVSMGYVDAAAELFHKAWEAEGDDAYLMLEGRAWLFKNQMDKAFECFSKIQNTQLLEESGINLKDMEKKWPFMNVRGFSLKKLFDKK